MHDCCWGLRLHGLGEGKGARADMSDEPDNEKPGLRPILEALPESLKRERAIRKRLLSDPLLVDPSTDGPILYQHSVLCQTCLAIPRPWRGSAALERKNGLVRLEFRRPGLRWRTPDEFMDVGLPYGPKPRLVLYHLNAEALRTQSPAIELEDSLTAFVKRTLGLDPKGRNIRTVKDQLTRLSAADFRIGTAREGRSVTLKGSVIEGFELVATKDPQQRVLWPTRCSSPSATSRAS